MNQSKNKVNLEKQFSNENGNDVIKGYINFLADNYGKSHMYTIFFARFIVSNDEVVQVLVDNLKDIDHMAEGV